jgi:hypothetical protein
MQIKDLVKDIQVAFPNAEIGRIFYAKHNILLEEQYGFTPGNTRFAEGGCSDEINEPEYQLLEHYWGERFKFGGLAGYCHGGKSGLSAVSHHVPEVDGKKNLLLVAGPHIGYYRGEWGKVPRSGQSEITTSCGSLSAVLQAGHDVICCKPADPLDRQQHTVEQLLLPYLEQCSQADKMPDLVDATKYLMQRIDSDLLGIVQDLETHFNGQIAIITGITINTEQGNYFSASKVEVHGNS